MVKKNCDLVLGTDYRIGSLVPYRYRLAQIKKFKPMQKFNKIKYRYQFCSVDLGAI